MSVDASGPGFSFGFRRPISIKLSKGESVIISIWKWKRFGFIRKLIQVDDLGNVKVTVL